MSGGSVSAVRLPRRSLLAGACGVVVAGTGLWTLRRSVLVTATPASSATRARVATWWILDAAEALRPRLRHPGDFAAVANELAARLEASTGAAPALVGFGPRLVAAVDRTLPGATALPVFHSDGAVPEERRGGDLALLLESSEPAVRLSALDLPEVLGLRGAAVRWQVTGRRGPARSRNALGFHDEIEIPGTEAELDGHVLVDDERLPEATICVLRLLELDVAGFSTLSVDEQEAVIGRRRDDGAPLSGGSIDDPVDLQARHPDGSYLIPERAHVRAAHPLYTGSSLMLRCSYDVTSPDPGGSSQMLFTSYQRSLDTFVATQRRLDETDELMRFVTPIGSASFLVVPAPGRSTADVLLADGAG